MSPTDPAPDRVGKSDADGSVDTEVDTPIGDEDDVVKDGGRRASGAKVPDTPYTAAAQLILAVVFGIALAYFLYLEMTQPELILRPETRWLLVILILILLGLAEPTSILPGRRS